MDAGEHKIDALEKKLAAEQAAGCYVRIEANLARERLRATLDTAIIFVQAVSIAIAVPIDEHIDEMFRIGVDKE